MSHSKEQPDYANNKYKFLARQQYISAYQKITGLSSIPSDRTYWTLCNKQPDSEGAEIVQLCNCGFLKKPQFFGIDAELRPSEQGIIEENRRCHPEANWFKGQWLDVIEDNWDLFNPALVYLDTIWTVMTNEAHRNIGKTMNMCPDDTVVVVNLTLQTGYDSRNFDPEYLSENLRKHVYKDWKISDCYKYTSKVVPMATYIFQRA